MNNPLKQIGFSQRIHLEWFEHTASLLLAGKTKEEISTELQNLLINKLSVGGTAERGNREKAISILMKCWVTVPKELLFLRNEGLSLLKHSLRHEHIALHWGMAMAAYPFWGVVAETTGRLLRLQDAVVASQVQRRIRELFGERETVSRATRRILRTFVDWRVLEETSKKGIYQKGVIKKISDSQLIAWVIEAALISSGNKSASLKAITHSPSLFPFDMALSNSKMLEESEMLELFRHGLDEEMVTLRNTKNTIAKAKIS